MSQRLPFATEVTHLSRSLIKSLKGSNLWVECDEFFLVVQNGEAGVFSSIKWKTIRINWLLSFFVQL